MNILGISALDTDSTVSLIQNGEITISAAEERFSRVKLHAGFPNQALEFVFQKSNLSPEDIDIVAYPFFPWYVESLLIFKACILNNLYNIFQKGTLRDKFYHLAYFIKFHIEATKTLF